MVISAFCMSSNLILYNSWDVIVVVIAISMPSNFLYIIAGL